MASRFAVLMTTTGLLGLSLVLGAQPAAASCHIAAFEQDAYTVGEAAGSVTVTIVLVGGQPSCSGAVRYETVAGSASAPGDFTAKDGVLCFVAEGDREKSVQIPITNDGTAEGQESFTVRLEDEQDPTCVSDNISGNATATVTITDDDQAAGSPPPTGGPAATAAPVGTAAPAAAPAAKAAPVGTAAPAAVPAATALTPALTPALTSTLTSPLMSAPTPDETATPDDAALAAEDTGAGTSGRGAVLGLAVAAVLIAAAAGLFAWRRRPRSAGLGP